MKNFAVVYALAFICLSFTADFAQSRRVTPNTDNETGKANKRPPQASPTPTPQTEIAETQISQDDAQTISDDGEVIRVDTNLVTIPVKVSDRRNRFVAGLMKEDFKVSEDGVEQEIALFANEQQPFTVALVLDMSYSTKFKITEIQNAAIAFTARLRPNDKMMIVSFDQEIQVLCEATSDRQVIEKAIRSTKISYGTSLYEAVDMVMNAKLKKIDGRKAIVLFTDGVDTTSREAHDLSNLRDAQELDALIYPIQYDTFADVQALKNKPVITQPTIPSPIPSKDKSPFPFPIPISGVGTPSSQGTTAEEYQKAGEYLSEMAQRTGGTVFQADTTANLSQAFSNIAAELREFYSIGYYPSAEVQAGKKRKIKVRVNKDGISVRSRDSYIVGKK
ncbi:MAG: VWA domain-containing protein [Acidobacteriota bacterium]|nr:VWA domain-containing protein [Acidobacteriota bacterium]